MSGWKQSKRGTEGLVNPMRDRLIELMKQADEYTLRRLITDNKEATAAIADYLIENGVIVLPCKVGDTVYYLGGIHKSLVKSATVEEIIAGSNGVSDLLVNSENGVTFENSVDVFYFTREEAEQALKGEHHAEIH